MDADLLADLAAEHAVLDALLASLDDAAWGAATPAPGWTIADQVEHLIVSERTATAAAAGEDVFGGGVVLEPVDDRRPATLLAAWRVAREETLDRLRPLDDRDKIGWGAGPMSAWSFAQARLMETWAHGLDCFAAAGRPTTDTPRLRHVAALAFRALPYAFSLADDPAPGDPRDLALVLVGPAGEVWRFGRDDAPARLEGPAGDWCRVSTRRLPPEQSALVATGALAVAALRNARAYLADGT